MSVSGILALTNQEVTGISTSAVDIEIREFKLNSNNQEEEYTESNGRRVLGGETVSLIPKIYNFGENCYIRIKVDYVDDQTDFRNYVSGFSDKWDKSGDYYYYKDVVKKNDIITLFNTIDIPDDIREKSENGVIELKICAEAIQEKNTEIKENLSENWEGITPAQSIGNAYNLDIENNSKTVIRYENDTNKDVSVPNSFLNSFSRIMPGDRFKDSIEIKNSSKENKKYYIRTDTNENNTKELELLDKIELIIVNQGGSILYSGKLLTSSPIFLGEYSPNDEDKLEFYISIPSELENEYSILSPNLNLVLSSEEESRIWERIINPKTGDSFDLTITIFILSSISLIILMIIACIEKRKENIDSI